MASRGQHSTEIKRSAQSENTVRILRHRKFFLAVAANWLGSQTGCLKQETRSK